MCGQLNFKARMFRPKYYKKQPYRAYKTEWLCQIKRFLKIISKCLRYTGTCMFFYERSHYVVSNLLPFKAYGQYSQCRSEGHHILQQGY